MTGVVVSPSQRYAQGVAQEGWRDDPAQHPALQALDRIHAALLETPKPGFLERLRNKPPETVRGLYYWGEVGRGKTFLVDLFYDGLPFVPLDSFADAGKAGAAGEGKFRTHFHRFMRMIHERLREHAGAADPLAKIVREARANRLRVLVLDEFFVTDIGDAMLLARLLERLFAEGITLVTTSNTAPENLYKDGLQRAGFLPAIALLQQHCEVLRSDGQEDYRLRALTRSPVYRISDAGDDDWLAARFRELSDGQPAQAGGIEIDSRRIPVRGCAGDIAWFDFAALCEGPRSTTDYIEIACRFNTLLVGGIPHFDALNEDAARRFVNFIDEVYDRHVNLVCTARDNPTALYTGHRLQGAFERTASRLIEMQSAEYLATPHRE